MNRAYRPVWVIFAVVVGLVVVSVVSQMMAAKEIIPWRTDFAAATNESRAAGKPLLLYFTATWCEPCQQMKRTTWADAKVGAALKSYVPVKIDVDSNADLAKRYLFTPGNLDGGIPAIRILGDDGQIRREIVGATTPDELLKWLNAR